MNEFAASIFTAVAICGSVGVWLATLRKNEMSEKKVRLNVQLNEADYDLVQNWAEKQGMTLSDYVRRTLLESVPLAEQNRAAAAPAQHDVLDQAFDQLEAMDNVAPGLPGVFGLPPARKAIPGVITEAERTHPQQRVVKTTPMQLPVVPPGPHPCMHLSARIPAHLRGQCQGICTHRDQDGRICYWTPTTCVNCSMYEPKASHRQPTPR